MRAAVVVEADPVANGTTGVPQAFKAMAMNALLLQCPDDALHQAVLLRRVGRNELLA